MLFRSVLATPTDVNLLEKPNEAVAHSNYFIMDRVKDHVVPHIAEKAMTHEMWVALTTLYEGRSV